MPSVKLPLLLAAALAVPAPSATAKKAAAAHGAHAAPETVYVQVTPPREGRSPVPETRELTPAESRRAEAAFASGPTRDFDQAVGGYVGFYGAEVYGSTPYANLFWELYPQGQTFFFQFAGGLGTVQSSLSRNIIGASRFDHPFLATAEALGGYSLSGLERGDGRGAGLFPYFVAGITAVYQGGSPNIGGVLGFGNRMAVPFVPKSALWALNYGMRDHMYAQRNNNFQTLTQNLVLLVGVQRYY